MVYCNVQILVPSSPVFLLLYGVNFHLQNINNHATLLWRIKIKTLKNRKCCFLFQGYRINISAVGIKAKQYMCKIALWHRDNITVYLLPRSRRFYIHMLPGSRRLHSLFYMGFGFSQVIFSCICTNKARMHIVLAHVTCPRVIVKYLEIFYSCRLGCPDCVWSV